MTLTDALTVAAPVKTLPLAGAVKHSVTEYAPPEGVLVAHGLAAAVAVGVGARVAVAVGLIARVGVAVGVGALVGLAAGFAFTLVPAAGLKVNAMRMMATKDIKRTRL